MSEIVSLFTAEEAVSRENFNRRLEEINQGAATAGHTHGAGDVTGGVLAPERGGTGQTSLAGVTVGAAGKLSTARSIGLSGGATGTATSFDGSASITIPVTGLDMSKAAAGVLPVARGGTGAASLQAARNAMGLGNTTGALPAANGGTGATSLQAARNAMGLGNTTGALPVANGGTGAATAVQGLKNLCGVSDMTVYYNAESAMSADKLLDSLALIPLSSTVNPALYNLFSGQFAYVLTLFHGTPALDARRIQLAFSFWADPMKAAMRCYTGAGGWTGWVGQADGGNAQTVDGYHLWKGTQAQYDAISSKSDTTVYLIVG